MCRARLRKRSGGIARVLEPLFQWRALRRKQLHTTLGKCTCYFFYRAATAAEAEYGLQDLEAKWKAYPSVSQVWRRNWARITPFFNYPLDIRNAIYTTNSVESLNR